MSRAFFIRASANCRGSVSGSSLSRDVIDAFGDFIVFEEPLLDDERRGQRNRFLFDWSVMGDHFFSQYVSKALASWAERPRHSAADYSSSPPPGCGVSSLLNNTARKTIEVPRANKVIEVLSRNLTLLSRKFRYLAQTEPVFIDYSAFDG